jgi:hypothetical protein
MARLAREEVFAPDEVAVVHVMNRVVRRCFLFGTDAPTGKNYDHRKSWIEDLFQHFAGCFGIDLLCFAILSNHFHLVLRSRPDVVSTWDDFEVARRWLLLCPVRKHDDGTPKEPSEAELNAIRNDAVRLAEIRRRLSDISWWMRLVCQRIATRANHEDGEVGKFWQSRFRAVRLLDEESLLACAAYVDLNPIRAALAETLGESDFTSVQRRIQSLQDGVDADQFLAPLFIDETTDSPGPHPSLDSHRCSDKGFLPVPLADYLQLLDWTARQTAAGKLGSMPAEVPPIFERLSLDASMWCQLVRNFGKLFYHVAGKPQTVDDRRSRVMQRRFHLRHEARELLATA